MFIRDAPAGMGAARAGLVADDEVVTIDGKSAQIMSPEEIHKALQGDVGSSVVLTIRHGDETRAVKVERSPLQKTLP